MQLVLTYNIEILILAFVLLMAFDFVVGLLRLWQESAPKPTTQTAISDNIYNFGNILALSDTNFI